MISFRHFLQRWPRPTRFWVLALVLLQFVAPTWHVCEMGGHVGARGAAMQHHGAAKVEADSSDPRKPLICYCAPHSKPEANPDGPQLSAAPSHHNHATCLALLLQTLPAQCAAPPAIFEARAIVETSLTARRQIAPAIAAWRQRRGRAPPLTV